MRVSYRANLVACQIRAKLNSSFSIGGELLKFVLFYFLGNIKISIRCCFDGFNDTYRFSYNYEIVVNRFGDGDDDVELANATVDITVSWDDSSVPGYIISWNVDAPTSLPNEWTNSKDEIVYVPL